MTDDSDDHPRNGGKRNYAVGYGKPPASGRFKPGQSGNPRGRRKDTRNITSMVRDTLREKIAITEDGKRRLVPKVQVVATQLVNGALKGNLKSIEFLVRLVDFVEGDPGSNASGQVLTAEQRQMILNYFSNVDTDEDGNDGSK